MMRIDLIAWARPNFMKIAPILDALSNAKMQVVGITKGNHRARRVQLSSARQN